MGSRGDLQIWVSDPTRTLCTGERVADVKTKNSAASISFGFVWYVDWRAVGSESVGRVLSESGQVEFFTDLCATQSPGIGG